MIIDIKSLTYQELDGEREPIENAKRIILYHGTSSNFREYILSKGITCRRVNGNSTYEGREGGLDYSIESNPNLVYLGSLWNAHVLGKQAVSKFGGTLEVYRAIFDPTQLLPDEDSKRNTWQESLLKEGSCAIEGEVPLEFILGYFKKHPTKKGSYQELRSSPRVDKILDF